MTRALHLGCTLAVLLPLMAAGCRSEPDPSSVRQRGVALPPMPPSRKPAAAENTRPDEPLFAPAAPSQPEPNPAQVVSAEEAAPDAPEKPPRNLQNELETMIGSPASCLAPRAAKDAPSEVRISLSASVMPSGAVGRGEVSAPGLQPDEIKCVRERLESLRFSQPVENAPLTVNGAITLNRGS